ncbi:MAG: FMN-binding negative transcriptional regulator, partial [Pontibacterium sp.]
MHCPKTFREERLDVLQQLIKAHPLATLITAGTSGLMANLIPFTLDPDNGKGILRAHLARGNSQLSEIREGAELLVVFQGPQCYISPSWYASKKEHEKVVPTWNYVTVQVRGEARVIEDATWLRAQVEILTSHQERNRAEPWHVTDAPDDFINA